jgi:hypothetical protein
MASATNLNPARTPRGDAAVSYATRPNITVPGADQTDAVVGTGATSVNQAAATRDTERITLPNASTPYTPDAADYFAKGSERSAP